MAAEPMHPRTKPVPDDRRGSQTAAICSTSN